MMVEFWEFSNAVVCSIGDKFCVVEIHIFWYFSKKDVANFNREFVYLLL